MESVVEMALPAQYAEQGLWNGTGVRPSVCLSVCLSRCSSGGAVSTQPGADSRAAVARGRIVLNASRIQADDVRVSL